MPVALERSEYGAARPRLGFAGLGWIGAQRMHVLADSGAADVAVLCEPDANRLGAACAGLHRQPAACMSFEDLLEQPLDGVVIATPNVLHEPQVRAALERDLPVFCQKPLALSRPGTERLIALARRRRVPLGIDWSYRHLAGMGALRQRIRAGEIGAVFAAELCFHNAYGPAAAWYDDVTQSGGGCLLDLGCHLLDLCHWLIGLRDPVDVRARCFRRGARLEPPVTECEDFVLASIEYAAGAQVRLACSWRASTGRGAVIGCRIFGTDGGAEISNVGGSFYDFEVALHRGPESELLGAPPDPWPGRALTKWTRRLRHRGGDDLDGLSATADVIDRIYGRPPEDPRPCAS